MKTALLILLLLSQPTLADIYKWVDESGRVHYSDTAASDRPTETVEIRSNSYQSPTYAEPAATEHTAHAPKKVIMYSTSWCGYCKKARSYFRSSGIAFSEFDIEKDQRAKRKYDAIGGRGVPVILIGSQRMNGFSAARFDQLYRTGQR